MSENVSCWDCEHRCNIGDVVLEQWCVRKSLNIFKQTDVILKQFYFWNSFFKLCGRLLEVLYIQNHFRQTSLAFRESYIYYIKLFETVLELS